jgi:hypothetical protein
MKTFITLSLLCVCLFSKLESKAQFETYVQANVVSYYPPVGPYNYFGYDLTNLTDQTITVEGYLREEGGTSMPNYYFTVTLSPYENVTSGWVYVLGATSGAEIFITNVY